MPLLRYEREILDKPGSGPREPKHMGLFAVWMLGWQREGGSVSLVVGLGQAGVVCFTIDHLLIGKANVT